MKHPSLRFRLMLGTGLLVAVMLFTANLLIYRSFERTLSDELEKQLLQSASLLAKSAELEATGLVYEWQEAMESQNAPEITGMFEFLDVSSGQTTKSPDLGSENLPFFHGEMNERVIRNIVLEDGSRARAVGLLHLPFTDEVAIEEAAKMGKTLHPESYPQVVVCAQETESMFTRLAELRSLLIKATITTLLGIWAAIFGIASWCFRPIRTFSDSLLERSEIENPAPTEIPINLPSELVPLAGAFNTTLDRVERARAREKEFALHAAHELRTPVAGILATLEQAVMRPRQPEDLTGRIGEALKITSGMRLTLDSLMRLARLRGGLEKSTKESFDPLATAGELIDSLRPTARQKELEIVKDFPASVAPLENDPGLFRVMVSNLVENAAHHSPPRTTITFTIHDAPGSFNFTVANPCQGLTSGDIGRIFQPFQRGSTAGEDDEGHAGLGLSLALEAAVILGGSLKAEIVGEQIVFTAIVPR